MGGTGSHSALWQVNKKSNQTNGKKGKTSKVTLPRRRHVTENPKKEKLILPRILRRVEIDDFGFMNFHRKPQPGWAVNRVNGVGCEPVWVRTGGTKTEPWLS